LKATLRNRVNPGGFCVAAAYALIVVLVLVLTASTTRPGNAGLDWIAFILLSMPWYGLDARLLVPGLIANAGLMYLMGTLLHIFWRRVIFRNKIRDAGNGPAGDTI
jgi:hypothetical protein